MLAESEFDGRDGKDVVCGFGRGGAKQASYASDCVVLGNLEVPKGRLRDAVGPNGGAKGENGENDSMVYLPPVKEVESAYGVAKEVEGPNGGSPACRHGGSVRVPLEVVL